MNNYIAKCIDVCLRLLTQKRGSLLKRKNCADQAIINAITSHREAIEKKLAH